MADYITYRATEKEQEALRKHLDASQSTVRDEGVAYQAKLPTSTEELLHFVLENLASGRAITILPDDSEISTSQAARILNVSRPHVTKLLKSGELPHHKVGSHHRMNLKDVLEYDQQKRRLRSRILDELALETQRIQG